MRDQVYQSIKNKKAAGKKSFAVLVDPDKVDGKTLDKLIPLCIKAQVDYLLVGGSLVISSHLDEVVVQIKNQCDIPVILFPGAATQVSSYADALLYLSVISGRNPELLIGQHVISAPSVKKTGIEIMSTGYMLIDGGVPTTVSYISNTFPIPSNKAEIAMCTAMAGEMLGMKIIYMDAGSGAEKAIPESMIYQVASAIEVPLVVGGGITTPEKAYRNCKAGADLVVVGNAIEKEAVLIREIAAAVHSVPVPS